MTDSVARSVFPGESPIGQRILIRAARPEEPSFEVVGVVGDVPHFGAAAGVRPQVYLPLTQALTEIGGLTRSVSLMVKTAVGPTSLLGAVRRQIWEIDRDLAVSGQTTLEDAIAGTWARPRFTTLLLGAFGAMATLLAAVGVYGLLAHLVNLRRHELGIRAALGATRRDLTGLVLGRGLRVSSVGLVLGLGAALLASRALERFLYATSSIDLLIFTASPVVLTAVVLLASTAPARRAATADPARTLRHD